MLTVCGKHMMHGYKICTTWRW